MPTVVPPHAHALDIWPMVSIAINVVIAVLGYLLIRWIAGQIRIAILELENRLTGVYSTKEDLAAAERRLDEKISLKAHMDRQFAMVRAALPRGGEGAAP